MHVCGGRETCPRILRALLFNTGWLNTSGRDCASSKKQMFITTQKKGEGQKTHTTWTIRGSSADRIRISFNEPNTDTLSRASFVRITTRLKLCYVSLVSSFRNVAEQGVRLHHHHRRRPAEPLRRPDHQLLRRLYDIHAVSNNVYLA